MPDETTTITGEVEKKEKSYQEKAHADKWRLNIGGVWVGMLKPKQEAFDAGASIAMAWDIAEKVTEGQWVKCGHEGQYKNIIELEIVARPEGAPVVSRQNGDLRNQWIAYESLMSSASNIIAALLSAGVELKEPQQEAYKYVASWIKWFPTAFKEAE